MCLPLARAGVGKGARGMGWEDGSPRTILIPTSANIMRTSSLPFSISVYLSFLSVVPPNPPIFNSSPSSFYFLSFSFLALLISALHFSFLPSHPSSLPPPDVCSPSDGAFLHSLSLVPPKYMCTNTLYLLNHVAVVTFLCLDTKITAIVFQLLIQYHNRLYGLGA